MLRVTSRLACWRERVLRERSVRVSLSSAGQRVTSCLRKRQVAGRASRRTRTLACSLHMLCSSTAPWLLRPRQTAAYIWRTPLESRRLSLLPSCPPHLNAAGTLVLRLTRKVNAIVPVGLQLGAVPKRRLSTTADGDWHDVRRRRG